MATTPTQPDCDTVATNSEGLDTYDVLDHSQQKTNIPHAKPANSTPVRDEASKRGDDFYDAEKHTYAAVSKKKAKKNIEQDTKAQDIQANPTPDVSKKGDDFYEAEKHTYSVVSKKKAKKKTLEDGKGEREELTVCSEAKAGDTSWMVQEGYSKLHH